MQQLRINMPAKDCRKCKHCRQRFNDYKNRQVVSCELWQCKFEEKQDTQIRIGGLYGRT